MNIHEHQAKVILNKFGVSIPNGFVVYDVKDISKNIKKLNTKKFVVKAQIHAGGRGKAGGIKIVNDVQEVIKNAKAMLGSTLVTPQTGPNGRKVLRLYIEETCEVKKEFYLSCLIDRTSSKIAFISSASGGMNIEEVAKKEPQKITTVKNIVVVIITKYFITSAYIFFELTRLCCAKKNGSAANLYA